MAQRVKPLPSAQVMISGSWDRAPHQALSSAGSLLASLSLPASLHTCDPSLSNKYIKSLKKKKEEAVTIVEMLLKASPSTQGWIDGGPFSGDLS